MNQKTRKAISIGAICLFAMALIIGILSEVENDFFQFCTTKAYGWPAPWKIEYCLCEKDAIESPASSIIVNIGLIVISGLIGFIATLLFYRSKDKKQLKGN